VLIRADDFYLMADPIRGQVYSAAVSTGLNPLFDHFFTIDLELDLAAGNIRGEILLVCEILIAALIFIIWHLDLPLSNVFPI